MEALIFTNFRATSQEKRRAREAREAKGYKSKMASSSRRMATGSPSSSDTKASSADSVTAAAAARVGRGAASAAAAASTSVAAASAAAAAVTITVGEVEAGMGEGAVLPPTFATSPSSDFVMTMQSVFPSLDASQIEVTTARGSSRGSPLRLHYTLQ